MTAASDSELWVALSLIPGLGNGALRALLSAFGEPREICNASYIDLTRIVKPAIARAICDGFNSELIQPTQDWLATAGNHVLTLADTDYPAALLHIPDPPCILYLKGSRTILSLLSFAIVGSRHATPQGLKTAESFALALSDHGYCIVSGLASGIDTAAHRGGLNGKSSSIAVVGTGLDIVYPAKNRKLAHEIAEHGALLSEYPLGTPALPGNFPKRNRIISGLSRGCLVVEAALQSGSLITARMAAEQGKEVFAIPGSIHSPVSKGCHALIKQGAKLVESAIDILEEIGTPTLAMPVSSPPDLFSSQDNHPILTHLGHDISNIDTLVERSGLTPELVSAMLLSLELDGRVASLPGGQYQRIT